MNPTDIIDYICDNISSEKSIQSILKKAFKEQDPLKLLKKRALLIDHCRHVLKELNYTEEETLPFNDIYKILLFNNLDAQSDRGHGLHLTPTHKIMFRTTFKMYGIIKKTSEVKEILEASKALKHQVVEEDETLTQQQKEILNDVFNIVHEAKEEHEMIGNLAINKLYERLIGKALIYKEELSSIKSQTVKDKLEKLYKKTQEVNEIMGFLLSIGDKLNKFIGFF